MSVLLEEVFNIFNYQEILSSLSKHLFVAAQNVYIYIYIYIYRR